MNEKSEILTEIGLKPSKKMVRSIKISRSGDGYRINGMTFPFRKYARRYIELFLWNSDGLINDLMVCDSLHPRISYRLKDNDRTITYSPTFVYYEKGRLILEDLLLDNPAERRKRIQMMADQHSIEVRTEQQW